MEDTINIQPLPLLVGLRRNQDNVIIFNSGRLSFINYQGLLKAYNSMIQQGLEVVEISPVVGYPPQKLEKGNKIYCPYCQKWESWVSDEDILRCPICGVSNNDYEVNLHNHFWKPKERQNK